MYQSYTYVEYIFLLAARRENVIVYVGLLLRGDVIVKRGIQCYTSTIIVYVQLIDFFVGKERRISCA
jgi:hypothetical protein